MTATAAAGAAPGTITGGWSGERSGVRHVAEPTLRTLGLAAATTAVVAGGYGTLGMLGARFGDKLSWGRSMLAGAGTGAGVAATTGLVLALPVAAAAAGGTVNALHRPRTADGALVQATIGGGVVGALAGAGLLATIERLVPNGPSSTLGRLGSSLKDPVSWALLGGVVALGAAFGGMGEAVSQRRK